MSCLIDSHCHLHDREFYSEEQAAEMLKRAHRNGVWRIVCIGTTHEDSLAARDFAAERPGVYWTYGVHPEEAEKLTKLETPPDFSVPENRPVAIGEVGLDYHNEGYNRKAQIRVFNEMLELATRNKLPVSFHIRGAYDDFLAIVKNFPTLRGVVHCFTGSKKELKRVIYETSFYVAVNGLATYATIAKPPLSRMVLETDAPFLAPEPFRSSEPENENMVLTLGDFRGIIKNEPAHIREIAMHLSEELGVAYELLEHETSKNAEVLFGFSDPLVRKV